MEIKAQNWLTFSGNVWKYNHDHPPFLVETTSFLSLGIMVSVKHFDAFLTSHHLHITIRHMHLLLSSAAEKLPFQQKQKYLTSFSEHYKSVCFEISGILEIRTIRTSILPQLKHLLHKDFHIYITGLFFLLELYPTKRKLKTSMHFNFGLR